MRQWIDKIASATSNVALRRDARLSSSIVAQEGYIVAGRVQGEKSTYNELEDVHGRMVVLHDGDVIAGVLGRRNALLGYSGFVPESVSIGDRLQLLNLGGVIGKCSSVNPDRGAPFDVEVLGAVLVFPGFEDRCGVPAHIGMNAIQADPGALSGKPVIYVAGTCMNSGKTEAASRLIRQLSQRGLAVAACKLTGVSLRRDALRMTDHGARWALTFTDAGIVSTTAENAVSVARTILGQLGQTKADVIVAELGDGIFGEYGVAEILADAELKRLATVVLLCANDPVGAWGAQLAMRERFGLEIDVVCGPTTDNAVGTSFVQRSLGVEAINARTNPVELGAFVVGLLNHQPEHAAS